MRLRHVLCALLVVAFGAAFPACLSPTLPLPPPDPPTFISQGATAEAWDVAGDCLPGATVTVMNEVTGRGAVVEDRDKAGYYTVVISGAECDRASVTEALTVNGTEQLSGATSFTLAPRTQNTPIDNPVCSGL